MSLMDTADASTTVLSPMSSPIPALISYYHRLQNDPQQDVAPFGYSRQRISFRVVIELDGRLHRIEDTREAIGKTQVPLGLIVPGQSKSPGSGLNPCFLWDNASYMLGYCGPDADERKIARTAASFEAFRNRHLDLKDQLDDPHYHAVCQFLEQWQPDRIADMPGHDVLAELGSGFGVFQVRAQPGYVHQRQAINDYWQQQLDAPADQANDRVAGQSLVSGRVDVPLARLHEPKIKGVIGGLAGGGVLVSFDKSAYTSYGKTQSYNAPMAQDEAFAYCTALNRLLDRQDRRARLGDTTVVFWSEKPTAMEPIMAGLFDGDAPKDPSADDAKALAQVNSFIDAARRGIACGGLTDVQTPFYVLGLSPNAARISLRFWLAGTVEVFANRLAEHVQRLEIVDLRPQPPLSVRRMLWQTAREPKDIAPQLAGEVARAILAGLSYPQPLFASVLRRVRIERQINDHRAAILKACLIRNHQMEVPVALDTNHPNPTYHMGRLFAALEKTQEDAAYPNKLNKTIKDGYFGTAAATPASIFPRLLKLHQHHIDKLEGGLRIVREQLIQEICSNIEQFPRHMPLEQQGLFYVAYYHQRQAFFTKRDKHETQPADAASA